MGTLERILNEHMRAQSGKVPLPNDVRKRIYSEMRDLKKNFNGLVTTTDLIKKVTEDIETLNAGRVPSGMKAFSMGYLVQEVAESYCTRETTLTITIKAGSSFEDAKEAIYIQSQAHMKNVDLSVAKLQRIRHQGGVDMRGFRERCTTFLMQPREFDDLGLEIPPEVFNTDYDVKAFVDGVFRSMLLDLRATRELRDDTLERDKRQMKDIQDRAALLKPSEVIKGAVIQALADERREQKMAQQSHGRASKLISAADKSNINVDFVAALDGKIESGIGEPAELQEHVRRFTKKELAERKTNRPPQQRQRQQSGGQSAPGAAQGATTQQGGNRGRPKATAKAGAKAKGKGKGKNLSTAPSRPTSAGKGSSHRQDFRHPASTNASKGGGRGAKSKGKGKNMGKGKGGGKQCLCPPSGGSLREPPSK